MFNLSIHKDGSDEIFINKAILVYQSRSHFKKNGFVTIHDVNQGPNGRPMILAGEPATIQGLNALFNQLHMEMGKKPINHWIDERLIFQDNIRTIWWTRAGKRQMFFDQKRMSAEIGKDVTTFVAECPIPPMVWMAVEKKLYVWALAENARPTRDTLLYQAPFFNVFDSGAVCLGTARVPEESSDFDGWDKMFFGSSFTHPNVHGKGRLIANSNPWQFWYDTVQTPPAKFPKRKLVKTSKTVGELANL